MGTPELEIKTIGRLLVVSVTEAFGICENTKVEIKKKKMSAKLFFFMYIFDNLKKLMVIIGIHIQTLRVCREKGWD